MRKEFRLLFFVILSFSSTQTLSHNGILDIKALIKEQQPVAYGVGALSGIAWNTAKQLGLPLLLQATGSLATSKAPEILVPVLASNSLLSRGLLFYSMADSTEQAVSYFTGHNLWLSPLNPIGLLVGASLAKIETFIFDYSVTPLIQTCEPETQKAIIQGAQDSSNVVRAACLFKNLVNIVVAAQNFYLFYQEDSSSLRKYNAIVERELLFISGNEIRTDPKKLHKTILLRLHPDHNDGHDRGFSEYNDLRKKLGVTQEAGTLGWNAMLVSWLNRLMENPEDLAFKKRYSWEFKNNGALVPTATSVEIASSLNFSPVIETQSSQGMEGSKAETDALVPARYNHGSNGAQTKEIWSQSAVAWSKFVGLDGNGDKLRRYFTNPRLYSLLARLLQSSDHNLKLLDSGCGNAYVAYYGLKMMSEQKHCFKVAATDLLSVVSHARKIHRSKELESITFKDDIQFTDATASQLNNKFTPGSVDVIVMNFVLQDCKYLNTCIEQMHSVLSVGGHAIIVIPNFDYLLKLPGAAMENDAVLRVPLRGFGDSRVYKRSTEEYEVAFREYAFEISERHALVDGNKVDSPVTIWLLKRMMPFRLERSGVLTLDDL